MFLTLIQYFGIGLIITSTTLLAIIGTGNILKPKKPPAKSVSVSTPSAELKLEKQPPPAIVYLPSPTPSQTATPKPTTDSPKKSAKPQSSPTPASSPSPIPSINSEPSPTPSPSSQTSPSITPSPSPKAAPTVSNFSPTKGRSGQDITINGSDFGETSGSILISYGSNKYPNGQPASVVSWSQTKIVAKVPEAAIGGKIAVNDSEGKSAVTSQEFGVVTWGPNLAITSISPLSGPALTEVTINGVDFGTWPWGVSFGYGSSGYPNGLEGNYVSWTDTKIVYKVPNNSPSGKIAVQYADTDGMKYLVWPQSFTVTPSN